MSDERRRASRQDMRWEALILDPKGSVVSRCVMVNVSASGAKLVLPKPSDVPDSFELVLSKNGGVRRRCEVTWRAEKSIGVQFQLFRAAATEEDEVSFISDMLARISPQE
jgi:hypothetical protein